jgi:Flp pilus assembly protein CpaB
MRLSRSTLLLTAGLVLSLATAGGLYAVASGQSTAKAQAPNTLTVTANAIVAKADIGARAVITPEMIARADLPTNAVPVSAAREEADVIGKTTLAPIPAGSVILRPQLAAAEGKTGLSIALDPGKVYVAFPTTDPLTTAGLVSVGDHVDLLATIVSGQGDSARKTQTSIQNLEVVQVLGPTAATPQQARALTFIVDHQTALFLKYLRDSQASVEIAIRSRSEVDPVHTQSVNVQVFQETFGFR